MAAGRLAALAAGLLICTGLACRAGVARVTPQTLTAASEDNGRTLVLRPGQALRVVLHENAATGYRWELEHADAEVIELAAAGGTMRARRSARAGVRNSCSGASGRARAGSS